MTHPRKCREMPRLLLLRPPSLALDSWQVAYKSPEKLTKRGCDLAEQRNSAASISQEVFKNRQKVQAG